MTRERRRTRHGLWTTLRRGAGDVPVRIAELLRPRRQHGKRQISRWTRPRRIAIGLTALGALLLGGVILALVAKGRGAASEVWRLHEETVGHFRAARYEEAASASRRILALNPHDAIARFNLGAALVRLGREDEGLAEIREAARGRPAFDDAHLALAQDALRRGDEDAALAELRLVAAEPPVPGLAASMLADLLQRRGRDAEAMPHLAAAADDAGAEPILRARAALALGRLHGLRAAASSDSSAAQRERRFERERYAAAREIVDAALAAAGGAAEAPLRAARAELMLALGTPEQALADADLAVSTAQDPVTRAEARLLRAQVYAIAGDDRAAEAEFDAVLAADAKPPAGAFRAAAAIFAARGRTDRALEVLAKGASVHEADPEIGLDRARLLFLSGDLGGAEAQCARLAGGGPGAAAALLLQGDLRRARDDLAGARAAYAEAARLRPSDPEAKLRLAGVAFSESGERGDDAETHLAEAERIANEVLATTPDDAGALLALAKVHLARSPGRDPKGMPHAVNAEARALLERSVEGDPLRLEARTFLAYAQHLTRRDQEAALALRTILDSLPGERPRLRLLLARCLLEAGLPAEAAETALRVTGAQPGDADAWRVRATACEASGAKEEAVAALATLTELEPSNLQNLFRQGALLAETGRFAAAEERFAEAERRAGAIEDASARAAAETDVAAARAEFYRLRGDVERAKATFGAALARGPADAAPYVRYARFLLKVGQTADAERQIERGLAVQPGSVEARRLLCEIQFARREVTQVLLNQVQEVERAAPGDPVVDYLRGKLAALADDLRVARDLLGRYAAARPDDPDGHYALGVVLGRAGDHAAALRHLERAGELLPGSPEVRVALAKVRQAAAVDLMRRGRILEAQAALRRVVSEDPGSREARALLVDSLRAVGEVELSEKEVRALLAADSSDRDALRMLAALQVARNDLPDAAATLRRLVELPDPDWTAWQFLSAVLADQGDLDAAETAAKAARACAPGEPGSLAATLHVLALRGQHDAAEREIGAAAERDPGEPQYAVFLAVLRMQQGRAEEAVAAAARALDLRPSMPSALQVAVHALSEGLHDTERAASFARERVARAPDDPVMAYQLASLEASLGRRDAALAALGPVCDRPSPLPAALALRGLLLLESGDLAAARAALRKGLDAYADAVDLHYLLAQSWLADPAHHDAGRVNEPARGFAIAELRAVLAVLRHHAPALNNLAWLLCEDEATRSEALELAETAVRLAPTSHVYLDTLGSVLLALGRRDQAVAAFRRALGICEAERAELEKRAAQRLSAAQIARNESLRRRLERSREEIRAHYDAALQASAGK